MLHAARIRKLYLYRAGISKAEIARRLKLPRTSVRRVPCHGFFPEVGRPTRYARLPKAHVTSDMAKSLDPFRFVLLAVAGWMNQRQLQVIEYLREENRVLREQLGDRRIRFTDGQRRRLAAKAKGLGRRYSRKWLLRFARRMHKWPGTDD